MSNASINEYALNKFNRLIEDNTKLIKKSEYAKKYYEQGLQNKEYINSLATAVVTIMEYKKVDINSSICSLTDGSGDNKIDLLYFDDESIVSLPNSNEKVMDVIVVQAKHVSKKAKNTFTQDEIELCLKNVEKIKKGENLSTTNLLLKSKLDKLREICEQNDWPTLRVHVFFSTNGIIGEALKRSDAVETAINNDINVKFIDGTNFGLKENVPDSATIKIICDDKNLKQDLPQVITGFITEVCLSDLVDFYKKNNERALLNSNVRYLLPKSKINKEIIKTASEKPELFWFFNNGITIIADDYKTGHTGNKEKINLTLTRPSIVNGGQTIAALSKLYQESKNYEQLSKAKVLLRVYKTKDPDIVQQIAQATNSQNPINVVDLKSNDPIQEKVALYFKTKGVALIVKVGQELTDYNDSITNENLLQAYVAMFLNEPGKAKVSKISVFNQYFDSVFSEKELENNIQNKLYNAYIVWKEIKNKAATDTFFSHAIYAIMYALSSIEANLKLPNIQEKEVMALFNRNIEKAEAVVKNIASKKQEELGSKFSYNNLFKNREIKDLIDVHLSK